VTGRRKYRDSTTGRSKKFFSSRNVLIGSQAHRTSRLMVISGTSKGIKESERQATHLHLVLKLRMSRFKCPLPAQYLRSSNTHSRRAQGKNRVRDLETILPHKNLGDRRPNPARNIKENLHFPCGLLQDYANQQSNEITKRLL
jgi:hypothetical protein